MDTDVDIYINSWQDPCVNAKINSWISQLFQAVFIELDKEIKMLGHNKMSHPLYTGAPCDSKWPYYSQAVAGRWCVESENRMILYASYIHHGPSIASIQSQLLPCRLIFNVPIRAKTVSKYKHWIQIKWKIVPTSNIHSPSLTGLQQQ